MCLLKRFLCLKCLNVSAFYTVNHIRDHYRLTSFDLSRKQNKELTPRSRSTLLIVLWSCLCLSSLCFILWSWSEKSIILWSEQGPLIRLDFPCLPAKHDALPSLACLKEDFQFDSFFLNWKERDWQAPYQSRITARRDVTSGIPKRILFRRARGMK